MRSPRFLNLPYTTLVNWKNENSAKYLVQDPMMQRNGWVDTETSPQALKQHILSNLENETYSLLWAPRILQIDTSDVYVNKDGPYQNVIESFKDGEWNKVLTPKLKSRWYGQSSVSVGIISLKYFESQEKLDTLYSKVWEFPGRRTFNDPINTIDKIFFEDALKNELHFEISLNMDYYLSNREEMEKDLRRKLENPDLKNEDSLKQLEKELFFNQCIQIFGDENDEEEKEKSTVIFRDFRILRFDGNDKYATARRGDNYLIFCYEYY